jgi:hypothetical protein
MVSRGNSGKDARGLWMSAEAVSNCAQLWLSPASRSSRAVTASSAI